MKGIAPLNQSTIISEDGLEWVPRKFSNFTEELENITSHCRNSESMVLFRGHSNRNWIIDSTFVRSCKKVLFGLEPEIRLPQIIRQSMELHKVFLNLLLLKYGVIVRPTRELEELESNKGIDSWFELMKRYQQYPKEDLSYIKGSNLIDWTQSAYVALYFANEKRIGDGALWICDATATGKTLQTIFVGEILDKMDKHGNDGNALGIPLIFYPPKQINNLRANNQQAVYIAQMDLRHDLEYIWKLCEKDLRDERIIIKLVLPDKTQDDVKGYLKEKGITRSFIFPDA